jgi:hypothetical protein
MIPLTTDHRYTGGGKDDGYGMLIKMKGIPEDPCVKHKDDTTGPPLWQVEAAAFFYMMHCIALKQPTVDGYTALMGAINRHMATVGPLKGNFLLPLKQPSVAASTYATTDFYDKVFYMTGDLAVDKNPFLIPKKNVWNKNVKCVPVETLVNRIWSVYLLCDGHGGSAPTAESKASAMLGESGTSGEPAKPGTIRMTMRVLSSAQSNESSSATSGEGEDATVKSANPAKPAKPGTIQMTMRVLSSASTNAPTTVASTVAVNSTNNTVVGDATANAPGTVRMTMRVSAAAADVSIQGGGAGISYGDIVKQIVTVGSMEDALAKAAAKTLQVGTETRGKHLLLCAMFYVVHIWFRMGVQGNGVMYAAHMDLIYKAFVGPKPRSTAIALPWNDSTFLDHMLLTPMPGAMSVSKTSKNPFLSESKQGTILWPNVSVYSCDDVRSALRDYMGLTTPPPTVKSAFQPEDVPEYEPATDGSHNGVAPAPALAPASPVASNPDPVTIYLKDVGKEKKEQNDTSADDIKRLVEKLGAAIKNKRPTITCNALGRDFVVNPGAFRMYAFVVQTYEYKHFENMASGGEMVTRKNIISTNATTLKSFEQQLLKSKFRYSESLQAFLAPPATASTTVAPSATTTVPVTDEVASPSLVGNSVVGNASASSQVGSAGPSNNIQIFPPALVNLARTFADASHATLPTLSTDPKPVVAELTSLMKARTFAVSIAFQHESMFGNKHFSLLINQSVGCDKSNKCPLFVLQSKDATISQGGTWTDPTTASHNDFAAAMDKFNTDVVPLLKKGKHIKVNNSWPRISRNVFDLLAKHTLTSALAQSGVMVAFTFRTSAKAITENKSTLFDTTLVLNDVFTGKAFALMYTTTESSYEGGDQYGDFGHTKYKVEGRYGAAAANTIGTRFDALSADDQSQLMKTLMSSESEWTILYNMIISSTLYQIIEPDKASEMIVDAMKQKRSSEFTAGSTDGVFYHIKTGATACSIDLKQREPTWNKVGYLSSPELHGKVEKSWTVTDPAELAKILGGADIKFCISKMSRPPVKTAIPEAAPAKSGASKYESTGLLEIGKALGGLSLGAFDALSRINLGIGIAF